MYLNSFAFFPIPRPTFRTHSAYNDIRFVRPPNSKFCAGTMKEFCSRQKEQKGTPSERILKIHTFKDNFPPRHANYDINVGWIDFDSYESSLIYASPAGRVPTLCSSRIAFWGVFEKIECCWNIWTSSHHLHTQMKALIHNIQQHVLVPFTALHSLAHHNATKQQEHNILKTN